MTLDSCAEKGGGSKPSNLFWQSPSEARETEHQTELPFAERWVPNGFALAKSAPAYHHHSMHVTHVVAGARGRWTLDSRRSVR